jgi:hypothetical protein
MAFTKPSVKLGAPRLDGSPARYTDKMEFLSTGVVVGFKGRPAGNYPTPAVKAAVQAAAVQARNIARIANDEIAKVVMLRKSENALFTATMATHFRLIAGDTAGGTLTDNVVDKAFSFNALTKHDRRWVLEKIRQKLLSISFHLNTGVYLIDMDTAARTVQGGVVIPAGTGDVADGYVHQRGAQTGIKACLCGFRNGEIHIDFNDFPNYSLNSCARIIIHEAAHKYLGVDDHDYAKDATYPPTMVNCLDNADSIAWAAVSLATGTVRMANHMSNDFNHCPGAAL